MEKGSNIPHGASKSIWRSYSSGSSFSKFTGKATADVVVIGCGITGVLTAKLLKDAGFSVIVLEAMKVGAGSTGHSTGNLYGSVEEGFDVIKSKYDTETLRTVYEARIAGVKLIEDTVSQYGIDCDFKKRTWYLYSSNEENKNKIEKGLKAALEAGLPISEVTPGELPFPVVNGMKIEGQAQFNPLRYVQQLAEAINGSGCSIYEDSAVIDIDTDSDKEQAIIKTEGGTVTAKYVVHATHTPKGVFLDFHSLLGTYREYGVAAKLATDNYPDGIFWGYYNVNERYSVRSYEHEGEKYVMCIGQPHQVGQKENNQENIANLEKFLKEKFEISKIVQWWGGQNYKPADGLPYIGRSSSGSNVFVATGFSTDGLTYGALSAIIVRDLLQGKETAYTKLFDASRHNPMKAAGKFIKENAINAAEVFKDYILFADSEISEIPDGEGKVVEVDGKKVAVYKSPEGVKACSAICTHLYCVVHWNGAEKTWDCPCHASRFDTEGQVLEGPAMIPLEKVNVNENK
jgi:glycine/D-amino acid oxidase-like deaminating enzyme/nitrite reductase/ring-hydroxylating ferredoxin subunit